MDRKPAIYWLSHKGMKALSGLDGIEPRVIHGFYKNKSLGSETRQHQLDIMEAYIHLRDGYGDTLRIQTVQDIAYVDIESLPKQKPDLTITGKVNYATCLVHDTPAFVARKRLTDYIDHLEDNGYWKEVASDDKEEDKTEQYPTLLFVHKDEASEIKFLNYAYKVSENIGFEEGEMPIATTTWELLTINPTETAVWKYLERRHKRESLK